MWSGLDAVRENSVYKPISLLYSIAISSSVAALGAGLSDQYVQASAYLGVAAGVAGCSGVLWSLFRHRKKNMEAESLEDHLDNSGPARI